MTRARPLAPLALALLGAPSSAPAQPRAAIPVARVEHVSDLVEVAAPGRAFSPVAAGARLRTGDRLRTGPSGTARLDFPWMRVTVAAGSTVSIPTSLVLATVLDEGRIEQNSTLGEIIKLLTAEATIRGEGRIVVRHRAGLTLVSVWKGVFRVEGSGRSVTVGPGQGTLVRAGSAPQAPADLPPRPTDLRPGADPAYARPGQPVTLSWTSPAETLQVEVLGIDADDVLISRDVSSPPAQVAIPWLGTYRWRLSARNAAGLEGIPSHEGLITVISR